MRELAVEETETAYVRLWKPDRDERTVFVTHLTPESATRYQFDIVNPEDNVCVFSKGNGTTPPRIVVTVLNENGFTVDNLPNIDESDPAVRAMELIDAIKWLQKHGGFEAGDLRTFAYKRALNVMTVVYASELIMDVIGEDEYATVFEQLLADASHHGRKITGEELQDPRTHDIEFLQTLLIQFKESLPRHKQEELIELAKNRVGVSVDSNAEPAPESQTWESETVGTEEVQLTSEAVEVLRDEGWVEEHVFE